MKRLRWKLVLSTVLVSGLVLTGCSTQAKDVAGMTEDEVMKMPLEEQYLLAGERHRALNELFAAQQREVSDEEWQDGPTASEVIPDQGGMLGELPGATNDNSYYFSVVRWYRAGKSVEGLVRRLGEQWRDQGWKTSEETSRVNGEIRVTATTPDGTWFEAAEEKDKLALTAFSPVYWGERRALSRATAGRRDAENATGATWDTADRNAEGQAFRVPGVYRPFPAWDAVPVDGAR